MTMRITCGVATAVCAVALMTGSASAADLPRGPVYKPVAMPPAFTWTGLYVGGHVAYGFGRDTTKEYFTADMSYVGLQNTFRPNGFMGGVHAGVNLQRGSWVMGFEGDVDMGNVEGGFVDPPVAPFNPGGRGYTRLDVQGSLRARLGYAFGQTMIYATAGGAAARIESTYFNWPGVGEKFDRTVLGYTVGAGVEHAFTSSLSARVEYRFTQYELFKNNSLVAFPGFTGTQEPNYHNVRAGVSYRF
jgi:outer membrane immunogenic protein